MALNRIGRVGPLLAMLVPVAGASDYEDVTAAPVSFDTAMGAADIWLFTCSTACYIAQGAAPTATAGDGSMFVPANEPILIDGAQGAKLSVIRQTADGVCTLQLLKVLQ